MAKGEERIRLTEVILNSVLLREMEFVFLLQTGRKCIIK